MASLVRWDPFRELLELERSLFSAPQGEQGQGQRQMLMMPNVDVMTKGNDLVVKAELPGVKPEDIDISIQNEMLVIKGERKEEKDVKEQDYMMRETRCGSFERRLGLPPEAEIDKVQAEFHDGVLQITVPKGVQKGPEVRHIEVKHNGGKQLESGQQQGTGSPQAGQQQSGQQSGQQQGTASPQSTGGQTMTSGSRETQTGPQYSGQTESGTGNQWGGGQRGE